MKVFAVLLLCTLAIAVVKSLPTGDDQEAFRLIAQRCKTESGATDGDVEELIMHQPASSIEAKCMRSCLMKEFNVMNGDGKFVKENALKIAEMRTKGDPGKMAIANEIADVCKETPVSDDHCEAAEQYSVCFLAESEKRGISPVEF